MSTSQIYISDKDKIKLMRKARSLNLSFSKLLVYGGLEYNGKKTNAESETIEGGHGHE